MNAIMVGNFHALLNIAKFKITFKILKDCMTLNLKDCMTLNFDRNT